MPETFSLWNAWESKTFFFSFISEIFRIFTLIGKSLYIRYGPVLVLIDWLGFQFTWAFSSLNTRSSWTGAYQLECYFSTFRIAFIIGYNSSEKWRSQTRGHSRTTEVYWEISESTLSTMRIKKYNGSTWNAWSTLLILVSSLYFFLIIKVYSYCTPIFSALREVLEYNEKFHCISCNLTVLFYSLHSREYKSTGVCRFSLIITTKQNLWVRAVILLGKWKTFSFNWTR